MSLNQANKKIALEIWNQIQKSQNILLHLHPSPDGDSLGSALAMYHFLKSLGKNPTLIKGDSNLKNKNIIFPGFNSIFQKNIFEINIKNYDLFIILDSSSPNQISKLSSLDAILSTINTIVIDHHPTNTLFANLNLVIPQTSSTCEIVYHLFNLWKIKLDSAISTCLFLGIYSDTSGFVNINTSAASIKSWARLSKNIPNLPLLLFLFTNNRTVNEIDFIKLCLEKYQKYFSNKVAISFISLKDVRENNLDPENTNKVAVSELLRSCSDWVMTASFIETEPGKCEISMRSRVPEWDVSAIALKLNGGGHKVAAGATIYHKFDKAKDLLLKTIQNTYPDLGEP